jgi:DNA invertase Pin-like site-specific DNA recombinase
VTTRVAIYARVSTGEQSPKAQLRELRVYAEHRGFHISREYVDQASGDVRRRDGLHAVRLKMPAQSR